MKEALSIIVSAALLLIPVSLIVAQDTKGGSTNKRNGNKKTGKKTASGTKGQSKSMGSTGTNSGTKSGKSETKKD